MTDDKKPEKLEAVIRFRAYDPHILTTAEFETLEREVTARIAAGDAGIAERILTRMIMHNRSRYVEAKERNLGRRLDEPAP